MESQPFPSLTLVSLRGESRRLAGRAAVVEAARGRADLIILYTTEQGGEMLSAFASLSASRYPKDDIVLSIILTLKFGDLGFLGSQLGRV